MNQLKEMSEYKFADEEWFNKYQEHLREKIRRLETSEQSARQLHGTLVKAAADFGEESTGPYLEKHKLAAIQRRQNTW